MQLQYCTYQRKTLLVALIKVSTFICKTEISCLSSPLILLILLKIIIDITIIIIDIIDISNVIIDIESIITYLLYLL